MTRELAGIENAADLLYLLVAETFVARQELDSALVYQQKAADLGLDSSEQDTKQMSLSLTDIAKCQFDQHVPNYSFY